MYDHTLSRQSFPWSALLQALVIAGTGVMLLVKAGSGVLPLYVHVKYTPLVVGTGVVLVGLGLVYGWFALRGAITNPIQGSAARFSLATLALLLPLLFGLFVPSRPLGSAALSVRGLGTTGTGMRTISSVSEGAVGIPDPSQWSMLDWVNGLLYQPDNPALQGQPIELVGFVWHRDGMAGNQFVLSRFVLSCCTADSLAIGLPVIWEESPDLSNDSWVRVKGVVSLADVQGKQEAVIQASEVVSIPQPAEPYLYP